MIIFYGLESASELLQRHAMDDTGDQHTEEKPANCYEQRKDQFFQQDFDIWQNFTTSQEDEKEAVLYEYEATTCGPFNDKHEALNAKDVWRKIKERQNEEFPEDSANFLDIFEFRRCDPEKLSKDFVNLFENLNYPGLNGFLDAREAGKSFTGVRLSGSFGDYEKSLLLTSIPILSLDKGRNNSLIHHLQGSPNFGRETVIRNHNFEVYITIARCFVMDNISQQQMIGDIYKNLQMNNATDIPDHVFENASLIGQYIELVDMITGVMNDQLMAVLQMKNMQIKQAASAKDLVASVDSANETLKALSSASSVVNEALNSLSDASSAMNETLNSLSGASSVMNKTLERTEKSQSTIGDVSQQQLEHIINMSQEAAYQGDLFSFFTVITTLFLPLGFLAQYAALNLDSGGPFMTTHRHFWRVVGPVTSAFAISIAIFITLKKYKFDALITALGKWEKPVSKKEKAIDDARNRASVQIQASTAGNQSTNQASGTGYQAPGLGSAHVQAPVP
ncbi:hypothetical protein BZA77DRAFT_366838 [Pyronema omphalodes]|nr:hypothetical protein BZA77DRAFT_366838 [Pyronema omphalodes]